MKEDKVDAVSIVYVKHEKNVQNSIGISRRKETSWELWA
jgi:hypothetical protein